MNRLTQAAVVAVALTLGADAGAQPAAATEDPLAPLAQALADNPNDSARYDAYVKEALRLHRWDEAIARLQTGVVALPSYHMGWYKLAYAHRSAGHFLDAAKAYRRYAELEPDKADPYFGLAASLESAGDKQGAVAAYRRYLELEKSEAKQQFVAQAKAQIAKLEVAASPPPLVESRPVVALPTGDVVPQANALSLRATAERARRGGNLGEAATGYERALAADPGNLDLHVELGDVYFAQKRYVDAARTFAAAVAKDGSYALGWYDLAHAQSRAGDHAAAIKAYREYIRLRPSDPDPFYGLGQTCRAMGDVSGAIEALRTYLKMEHRPESKRWVDQAREDLGTLEGGRTHGSLLDLKNPFDGGRVYASADDFLPPGESIRSGAHERIQRELTDDDILPVDLGEHDAVKDNMLPPGGNTDGYRERLGRYAVALAAYRSALVRQVDQMTALYQRGTERVIANDLRGAQRTWADSALSDRSVEEARQRLLRARVALSK